MANKEKNKEKKEEDIVRFVGSIDNGTYIVEHADGQLERVKDETDWVRVDAMTEEEVEAAARADPEWEGLLDIDWNDAVPVMPRRKEAISIRLDEDVLSYFRNLGTGYQTRINAVLRHFMEQTRGKRK
jgi:uncharacterized protein (DUF4415 family)